MTEPIACNLAGNALDYLLMAGQMANDGSPRALKHAVATLADGIELLLKARLEVYDWSLLFKNVDDADRVSFQSGNFQSVKFDQAIRRLNGICGVEINTESLTVLNALRKLRNKIRHFAVTTDKTEAASLLSKTYGFAIDFATEHLEEHLDDNAQADLDRLRRLLGEFTDFVDARLREIQPIIDDQDYAMHVECMRCLQVTLYASEGESSCAFCGYRASGEEAATDWFDHHYGHLRPKEMMIAMDDMGVGPCPECGADAAIPLDEGGGCHCLSCGETSHLRKCLRCSATSYDHLCDYCRHLMEKDD